MLRCPFCDADLNDVPLQAGRCPTCGSVMAWQDDEPETPPRRETPDERSGAPSVADGASASAGRDSGEIAPEPPRQAAVAISETHQISEPVPGPTSTGSEGDLPPRERHSTIHLNGIGTVDEDEIRRTIAPRPLSGEELQTLQKNWKSTILPGTRANMTIKTQEAMPANPVTRRVPTRVLRDHQEGESETADYRLLEIIGEGGVGIVYAAQQTSVDRTVALKMLRSDITTDWEQRQKFLSEAVVTGDLDHPNIVPIYELGSGHDGALFYAMKRVSGTPWSDVLMAKSLEENLEILMKVGDAVAFAHSRGVVHRDLKPENVMLGDFGEVQVMDWGIALPTAKFHRAADILTTGSLGGTPAYMAPEMATGPIGRIGPSSDVYLLGGILFEIVTGLTPHSGGDVMECLHAAAANEIQPTPKTGELLNIALQAMSTNPADRFETVPEFQAAIREYQSHTESIALSSRAEDELRQAEKTRDYQDYSRALFALQESYALWPGNHRAGMGITAAKLAYAQCALEKGDFDLGLSLLDDNEPAHQRARVKLVAAQRERDARQQKVKAARRFAGLLVVALFVVVGSALVLVLKEQSATERQRDIAQQERDEADKQRDEANIQRKKAVTAAKVANTATQKAVTNEGIAKKQKQAADRARTLAERQQQLALAAKSREEIAKLKTQYETYLARIALAAEKINGNAFDDARRLLAAYQGDDLRHWEWARLWYLCERSDADFPCNTPLDAVAFSPDGREFVTAGQDGVVRIWKTSLMQNVADAAGILADAGSVRHDRGGQPPAPRLTFPVRSDRLQAVDRLKPVTTNIPIRAVAWGRIVVNGQPLSLIATAGERGSVNLWRANDGSLFKSLTGHSAGETVTSAVFSTTERHNWLVTGSTDHTAIVWDVAGTERPVPLRGHSWWVWDVAVSRDQSRIATAGQDGKIILWKVAENDGATRITVEKELADYHAGPVYSIALSPDGKRAVSGGYDNRALVWKLSEAAAVDLDGRLRNQPEPKPNWLVLRGHTGAVRSVTFSPDDAGRLILTCGDDNTVSIWNSTTGTLERTLRGHGSFVRSCAFSPVSPSAGVSLRSNPGHPPTADLRSPTSDPRPSSDDRLVLSGSHDGRAKLWQIAGYNEVRVFRGQLLNGHEDEILAAVYGPRGDVIATAGKDRTIRVYDVKTNRSIIPGDPRPKYDEGHDYLASSALFFRKGAYAGRRFVTSAMDGTVRIWQLDSGTEIVALRGAGSSGAIALSHDEGELAACGRVRTLAGNRVDYPILVWPVRDLDGNAPVPKTLSKHVAEVTALAYSPDGKMLVSGDAIGVCLVWERTADGWSEPQAISRKENGRRHSKRITGIAFLDSGRVATSSNDNTVSVWNVRTGEEQLMIALPDSVIAMDASPDGSRIVTTSRAGSPVASVPDARSVRDAGPESLLRIYSPEGRVLGQTILSDATVSSVRFSPDGRRVLALADKGRLWEWTPGGSAVQRATTSAVMWSASYAPDGKHVLTVGGQRAVLWAWPSAGSTPRRLITFGPHAIISHLSFSPGGRRLASADAGGTVKVWDLQQHRAEQVLKHDGGQRAVVAALFSPRDDALLFTVGAASIQRWRFDEAAKSWKPAKPFDIPGKRPGSAAMAAAISSDGTWLVVGMSDGSATVVSSEGQMLGVLNGRNGHSAEIRSVAVSMDDRWIVTGSEDKSAIVWERSPDGKHWDPIAVLSGHPAPVNAVAISRDRFRVLTGSEDKSAKIWDTRTLLPGAVAVISAEKVLFRQQTLDDLRTVLRELRQSTFARRLAGDAARKQRLIDRLEEMRKLTRPVSSAKPVKDVERSATQLIETLISHLGSDRIVEPDADGGNADPTANWNWKQVWSTSHQLKRLATPPERITEIFTLRGHERGVTAVTFSPRGDSVLTAGRDGAAIVWPAVNTPPSVQGIGEPLEILQPENGAAGAVPVAENAVVRDPDSPDFDGGTLIVQLASEENFGRLVFPRPARRGANSSAKITLENGNVSYHRGGSKSAVIIGKLASGSSDRRIAIQFTARADAEAVTACLRSIAFQPVRVDPMKGGADRRILFVITDGDGDLKTDLDRRILIRDMMASSTAEGP
jgi:hypothetical protein